MKIKPDQIPLSNFEIVTNDDPKLETISLSLFVAGCVRRCIGCQNPELQEITETNSKIVSLDYVKKIIEKSSILVTSVCFCGGDFLPIYKLQLYELVRFCKNKDLKTILYTGELFEKIDKFFQENINIIVCGPYDQSKKQPKFPASSNQRCWIDNKLVNCDKLKINEGGLTN